MPEGHVIHRLAGELNDAFAGHRVRVSSPQGRFADAAALLDGQVLACAQAFGKHLFLSFKGISQVVHLHLGLIGRVRLEPAGEPVAPETLRLRIENGRMAAEVRGPQTCALITPEEREHVAAALGPDPLRPGADGALAWARVTRSDRTIASLLLDQRVAAGVGNIYRCEVLFRGRLHPMTPGAEVTRRRWNRIWADLVELMSRGVVDGRIDTVRAAHRPEATGRPPRVDRHGGEVYVYRRQGTGCLVCGRAVSGRVFEGRNLYWCSRCQARR